MGKTLLQSTSVTTENKKNKEDSLIKDVDASPSLPDLMCELRSHLTDASEDQSSPRRQVLDALFEKIPTLTQ